ncbi:nuclear transport factor 2 family protein [Longispora albida]|uniref:nuclear transport factor 2 family protein n=1 Tax=Longispora albida TaxID=203523 RepID=UPI0003697B30|nr:nuclear transport factor 2 family protein [Longispora albida]
MSDIAETIETLYAALDARDGSAMAACYHPQARFRDPLFDLHGEEIGAMWRMLTGRSKDLRAQVADIRVTGEGRALAHWSAAYTVGGRPVLNEVKAAYRFADDGRIIDHVDAFDLDAWARQALGGPGRLLTRLPGGPGILRRKVRKQLNAYMAAR